LAVLVSDTGVVKHRQVVFERAYPRDLLDPMERLVNDRLRGQSFSRARETLLDHIEAIHQRQMDLLEFARRISDVAFTPGDEEDFFLEGAGNILSLPDFGAPDDMRRMANLLDEKRALGDLIRRDCAEEDPAGARSGVRVRIGSENTSPALRDLSLISSTYTVGGRQVGVLGIIGPKRMEYSRMMSLVNHMAAAVTQAFHRMVGEPDA
jgi:heat-inducible transcriptional repressor